MLRSVKYGLSGAVLAGIVAVPVLLAATSDKSVKLVVDGKPRTVHTSAEHVGRRRRGRGLQGHQPRPVGAAPRRPV